MKANKDFLYKRIGEKLKEAREAKGITQEQLAEACGVLRTSVTNLEAGRQKVPLSLIYDICALLKIEVTSILPSTKEVVNKKDVEPKFKLEYFGPISEPSMDIQNLSEVLREELKKSLEKTLGTI